MSKWIYISIYIGGVLISSIAQIILKKSSSKEYRSQIFEYLNPMVITAYAIFFVATFCSIYAYKGISLSFGPILAASEYIFVAALSKLILKENINRKKFMGLTLIVLGIIIYSINI